MTHPTPLAALTLTVLALAALAADPSCANIRAQPQNWHPSIPQSAAVLKCQGDCAQPGYNCSAIMELYPFLCYCVGSPSPPPTPIVPTPPPAPTPPVPTPAVDPSCAKIHATPQDMHPGVPQAAAEQKCRTDCAQPGFTCAMVAHDEPTICTCTGPVPVPTPATPTPSPPGPGPGPGPTCTNVAYAQCGGKSWTGKTCCPPYQGAQQICHVESEWYSQCCPPSLAGCKAGALAAE
jgi:hypothetical protein